MDTKPNINTTSRLPRQVKGGFPLLLTTPMANLVISAVEGLINLSIKVPVSDGTNTLDTLLAQIKLGDMGMEVVMPPQGLPGSGGTSTASLQWLVAKQDLGSCLLCHSWDGANEGSTAVYVAKHYKLWTSLTSETINGVTFSYTYSSSNDPISGFTYWSRAQSGSDGSSENDAITPPYLLNDQIWAITIPGLTLNGQSVSLKSIDERAWGAKQTV